MRNLFGTIARSTSAPAGYDQIDDTSEGRLKVHAEEAFNAGIKFKARFIGSLEIPKVPNQNKPARTDQTKLKRTAWTRADQTRTIRPETNSQTNRPIQ